jgi:hypothetical protein
MATMTFMSVSEARTAPLQKAEYLREATISPDGKDVFLSHSSKDHEFVPAVIALFREHGATVYVDDLDARLPRPPTAASAVHLKGQIAKARRLVVLATPNSHESRWIPWELGLGDGMRGIPPNAVFPVTLAGEVAAWTTAEYFAVYPKIARIDLQWRVVDPRGSNTWPLSQWVKGTLV